MCLLDPGISSRQLQIEGFQISIHVTSHTPLPTLVITLFVAGMFAPAADASKGVQIRYTSDVATAYINITQSVFATQTPVVNRRGLNKHR